MTALQMLRTLVSCCRRTRAMSACAIILLMGLTQSVLAQNGTNALAGESFESKKSSPIFGSHACSNARHQTICEIRSEENEAEYADYL